MLRLAWPLLPLLLVGCPEAAPSRDAGADARAADIGPDAPAVDVSAPEDLGPPPAPGSAGALLLEACAGRPRVGERGALSYFTGAPAGYLRGAEVGDQEAIRLTLTEPFRVRTLRLYLRSDAAGAAAGRARVRLTADIGRSIPDLETDLMAPAEVEVGSAGWYEVPVDPPVDLHPAYHPWVVVEHVTEPVAMAVARKADADGQQARSRASIAAVVHDRVMNPQGDPWLGLGAEREYMAEAVGERICPRQGGALFADVSTGLGAPLAAGRPQWVDVDGDGWDDLVAFRGGRGEMSRLVVFHNAHDGGFTDATGRTGLADTPISTATWADLDDDGDLDVFAGDYQEGLGPFPSTRGSRAYLQGGDGRFTAVDSPVEAAGPTDAHAMADCDHDGRLDLFVGQWLRTYPTYPGASLFFHGAGGGRFDDATLAAGLPGTRGSPARGAAPAFSAMWGDWDNDGDADLFVTNYLGMPNNLYQNDGSCRFVDRRNETRFAGTPPTYGTSFGIDLADYDNDGDLDAFEANIAHARGDLVMIDHSRLLRNGGAPDYRFENVTVEAGILHNEGDHEGMFGDWDNDGDLDLVVSVGPAYGYQWWRLYRQEPDHRFTDVTWLAGFPSVWSGGVMFADWDRDGDLDLAAGSATLLLLRNDVRNAHHWIELRLRDGAAANRDAVGARVTVTATDGVRRMREVTAGRGFQSGQGALTQHVGLGDAAGAVTVEVRWPVGPPTRYEAVAPDRLYVVDRVQGLLEPRR
jgi:hypothetical protein